jgi:hypothetical protein
MWGLVTGASHRRTPNAAALATRLTPEQTQLMRDRADAYLQQLDLSFTEFVRDSRTADLRKIAITEIARHREPR